MLHFVLPRFLQAASVQLAGPQVCFVMLEHE